MTDEQLAMNAQMHLQKKGGNLNEQQFDFAQDIMSTFQLLYQMSEWEKQYSKGASGSPGNTPLK